MDILYYSNYCKHSQKVLQFLVKGGMSDQLNFICIDKRARDAQNNTYIILENGKRVIMPPNVHSVPALLQVKHNYKVVLGDDIIQYFQPAVANKIQNATEINGEPAGFQLQPSNQGMYIVSEAFTPYNMSPEELSAKGKSANRSMYNYVKATDDVLSIPTPPDTYRPDKIASNVTIDVLEQKRFQDIPQNAASPFMG